MPRDHQRPCRPHAQRARRYLGGSRPLPLSETATAYQDGARALTIAEREPSHIHLYNTAVHLSHVLDQHHAAAWARQQLRPLLELPEPRRLTNTAIQTETRCAGSGAHDLVLAISVVGDAPIGPPAGSPLPCQDLGRAECVAPVDDRPN